MSNAAEPTRSWEIARYLVELRWHAPRTWGQRHLPRAGRFYAWAIFNSPKGGFWSYAEATGVIESGRVEITELAILANAPDIIAPLLEVGETFDLSRAGVEHVAVSAHGRVLERKGNREAKGPSASAARRSGPL